MEDSLNTPDDSEIGYFIEVDVSYPDNIEEKTKHFPFAPEYKIIFKHDSSDYMKKMKSDTYTHNKKLICDLNLKKRTL